MVYAAVFSISSYLYALLGRPSLRLLAFIFARRVWVNIAIALYITGCGVDDSAATKNETPTTTVSAPNQTEPEGNEEISVAPSQWPEALLVSTKDELPACSTKNKRQLVYVQETEEFQSCNGKEWASVQIGSKSVPTAQAQKGDKGDKGDTGATGARGEAGSPGSQAYVSLYDWAHPLTGRLWFLANQFKLKDGAGACPGGSSYPTAPDLADAVNAGLITRFGTAQTTGSFTALFVGVWNTIYIGGNVANRTGTIITLPVGDRGNPAITETFTLLCVKK